MKSKQSGNVLMLGLKKKTIAHLNHLGIVNMKNVKCGQMGLLENKVQETDPAVCQIEPTPVPTDFGITPGIPGIPGIP